MAEERRCICCGEVTDPDKLEVRADAAAPYVRTHKRHIGCQEHAALIAGLIAVNVATDVIRQAIAKARCEA
jgi:hypothetical protein